MRRADDIGVQPLGIEFSGRVWLEAGRLDLVRFGRLRSALDALATALAASAGGELPAPDARDAVRETTLEGIQVTYRIHRDRRCLELLALQPGEDR